MTGPLRRTLALVASAALAVAFGETLTARVSFADVYLTATTSVSGAIAGIVGAPEREPRALVLNGQPLAFAPYTSDRPVADIAADWAGTLERAIVPIPFDGRDPDQAAAAAVALALLPPKVALVSEEFATVVQFFDGDGRKALDHVQSAGKGNPARPIPATVVTIRRPAGAERTEVLMTRMEDAMRTLGAFAAPVDAGSLPESLKPPAGASVLMDLSDDGGGHRSRSIVSRGPLGARAWAERRAALLVKAGFVVEASAAGPAGVTTLRGRRGAEEADVLYTTGSGSGEVVEVMHIREPIAEGASP